MICYLFSEPIYLIFSQDDLPALLYYSHIPATIVALVIGLFVYFKGRDLLLNRLLLLISLSFSVWTFSNLILWTNIHSDWLLFVWPFLAVSASFLSILSIYFVYVFLYKKDIPFFIKLIFIVLLTPVLVFASTNLSLTGFDLANCDAFKFEGLIYKMYYTSIAALAIVWTTILFIHQYKKASAEFKKQILLMGAGIELFLFLFFTLIFLASYLTSLGLLPDSRIEMYGLFGMMIFMGFIGILIVEFKMFKIGVIASQALIVGLIILIGSELFFAESKTNIILISVTLFLSLIGGYLLVRSVKREVKQRKEIEKLAEKLEKANERLKALDKMKSEFVSIASHQLRSPLTSIRGYSSMLLEGSFGKLTPKAYDAISRIHESSRFMAASVEDYLNVSRIQAGNMKYEYSDFNVRDVAERVADDTRPQGMKKGLLITFKSDMTKKGVVHADIGKTRQVIDNLVNNAMKYTPKGSISILVHDNPKKKKIYIEVSDTGIGMSQYTIENMFEKFERASNANEVNVTGTGLGLYIARKMAREMGGDVTAHSEGEGKGSTFIVELPLMM